MKLWEKLKNRHSKAVGTIDRYQEAISFAQAGVSDEAVGLMQVKDKAPEPKPAKLLVLAQGSEFPEEMREYALDMAQRLGHEILALNTAPIKKETWRFFNLEQQNLREEFKTACEENFQTFQAEAEKRGVEISHLVKYIDKEEALQELSSESLHLDFIISDSETVQPRAQQEKTRERRPNNEICVYSLT